VLLIESPHHIRGDPDERTKRRRRLDAVLAAVPGRAEHHRHLLEVVHEEPFRIAKELRRLPWTAEGVAGKELLQLLCERRLSYAPVSHAEQFDLVVERRVVAIVERTDDVMRSRQRFVTIELTTGQTHEE
jgi:hypothetical protein